MSLDSIRNICLALPHATEQVQWGDDLVFKIAGKMFCVATLEPPLRFSFKCTPERFAELTEIEGIIPAPYMARNFWVSIIRPDALAGGEVKELLRNSYHLVLARLPKRKQAELSAKKSVPKRR